jgi:hypothetical protein
MVSAWLLLCIATLPLQGQDSEVTPAEVKAAFLVNFLRYTEWPAASFAGTATPFRVVVIGDGEVAEALQAVVRRSTRVGNRTLEVRSLRVPERRLREGDPLPEELRDAHAVYVGESDRESTGRLLEVLRDHDVLTVGGQSGFAALGGMIGLREEGRRIVFDANPGAIRRSRLRVSARVLQLARVVGPGAS